MQPLQKYVEALSGVTLLSKASANKVLRGLVAQGLTSADSAADAIDDLVDRSRSSREHLVELIAAESRRAIAGMGFASRDEVDRLRRQVAALDRELAAERAGQPAGKKSRATATKPSGKKKAAKKKPAKSKAAAKGTAKKRATTRKAKPSATGRGAKKAAKKKTASSKKKTAKKKSTRKKAAAKGAKKR